MSSTQFRRMRRKSGENSPKGISLKKVGADKKGNTVYNIIGSKKVVRLDRSVGKFSTKIPDYAFGYFVKPQERGSNKVSEILKN